MGAVMKSVVILGFDYVVASTITGPLDVFYQAGVLWNFVCEKELAPRFHVSFATTDGKPVRCMGGITIDPGRSIHDVGHPDLIIISGGANIEKTLRRNSPAIDWLCAQYAAGCSIASICSGAFFLAETGLLDGKTATTHWAFADRFKRRYPRVNLKPERLITDEGDLFCSGGYNAGVDLSLYLVEKYCGHEVALQSSKSMISEMGRTSQAPYAVWHHRKDHHDRQVLAAQEWIEANFDKNFTYDHLARRNGMSRRTMERRFKNVTGETPLAYQQSIRVEAAKRILEKTNTSFEEITWQVGYEDSSTFRKVFCKQTGLVPTEYRKKFQRI